MRVVQSMPASMYNILNMDDLIMMMMMLLLRLLLPLLLLMFVSGCLYEWCSIDLLIQNHPARKVNMKHISFVEAFFLYLVAKIKKTKKK